MTKAEIAKRVATVTGMPFAESLKTVDCVFKSISASIAEGHRVHFRSFGSFYPMHKSERIGRNPKTGEEAVITARIIPRFKASLSLRGKIN